MQSASIRLIPTFTEDFDFQVELDGKSAIGNTINSCIRKLLEHEPSTAEVKQVMNLALNP